MSVTPLMWKSLDKFEILFRFMYTNPMEYQPSCRAFKFNPLSTKMIPYVLSVIIVIATFFIPCLILLSCKLFGSISFPLPNTMLLIVLLNMSGITCLGDIFLSKFGGRPISLINFLIKLDMKLGKSGKFNNEEIHPSLRKVVTSVNSVNFQNVANVSKANLLQISLQTYSLLCKVILRYLRIL